MNISEVAPKLYLIALDQKKLPGFVSFIGSWLYKGEKTFLVDVGPSATIPDLSDALKTLGVQRLDAVLLTHIHIDHAGGIGDLISRFPDTPAVCHKSGIPHLEDPARLWEGSVKTLGDTARAYGPFQPVPKGLIQDAEIYREHGIMPLLTPGHAPHHVSYLIGDYLFAGEAGGVFSALPDGNFYLRPATPPRFFPETSTRSLESLMAVPHKLICYGHFGMTKNTPQILESHKAQLQLWADVIQQQFRSDPGPGIENRCMEMLLKTDPLLSGWHQMEVSVRERERYFLFNSIRGFLGWVKGER